MASVSSTSSASSSGTINNGSDREMSSLDFMKIMITELTNQDPFEPMSNADLVNQMSIMQQMQTNHSMSESFERLMKNFDTLISRDSLNTATGMVGQMVSGLTTSGNWTTGRVVAVNQEDDNIYLQLNTGEIIDWQDVERLGGNSSEDIVGSMAVGTDSTGTTVVGEVSAVELDDEKVTLHVTKFSDNETVKVLLSKASLFDSDTADLLIGRRVKGTDSITSVEISGYVDSVSWVGDNQVELTVIDAEGGTVGTVAMDKLSFIS